MPSSLEANAVTGRIGAEAAVSDPGPGERSGLSSVVAAELLDDTLQTVESEQAVVEETVDQVPSFGVGDDPAHPLHGSMAGEFEQNAP
ncbi:hypothetical protein HQQ80_13815 [Microbacteriaceae bacterium VKM Ac-2855]|nr:hypothetical protein [Microbacteriaceae bacterium VKM Ac-2855]